MQFQKRFINVVILFSDAQGCGSWVREYNLFSKWETINDQLFRWCKNRWILQEPQGLEEMLRDPHCEKAKEISTVWGANSFAPSFEIFRFEQ